MKLVDFQLNFEDLYNDYEMKCTRCEPVDEIIKKIRSLCNKYLKYQDVIKKKCLEDGSDCSQNGNIEEKHEKS